MMESLVSVAWLSQHRSLGKQGKQEQQGPGVVILDCRFSLAEPELGRSQYTQAHIPGAHYLHLNDDLSGPRHPQTLGGRHPLPDAAHFLAKLRSLGIGPETPVVAYDDSRFAFAARLWWMMRALGHGSVAVLDGGWQAWQTAGLPTESLLTEGLPTEGSPTENLDDVPPPKVQLAPQPESTAEFSGWMTAQQVKTREPGVLVVDSRSPQRYRGEVEPIDPIAGHIPGAVNAFWQGVTDEQGFALGKAAQRDRWQQVDPGSSPIGSSPTGSSPIIYCGSGVTACVNILSLELAGLGPARLYAGSWSDWCAQGGAIATGEA